MSTSPSSPAREWEKVLAAIVAKPEAAVFLPPLLDRTHQYVCAIAPHEFSCLLDVQAALAGGKYATTAEFVTALRAVFLTALRYYGPRHLDVRGKALKCLQEVDRLVEKTPALKGDYERTAGASWQPPEKAFEGARACRAALDQLLREHKDAVDMFFWAPEAYFDAADESDYYDHVAVPASISDVSERLYNGQAVTAGVPVPPLVALMQGPHPPASSYGSKSFPWERRGASHYVMAPALATHPEIAYQPLFIYPGPFTSCAEFEADVCRVFDNAATYHEGGEDSELVPRARALRDAFKAMLATHLSMAKFVREKAAGDGLSGSGLGSSGGPGGSSGGGASSSPATVAAASSSSTSSGGVFFGTAGLTSSSSAAGSRATSPAPIGLMGSDVAGGGAAAAVAGYYGSSSGGAGGVSSSSGSGGCGAGVSAPPSPPPPVSRPPFVSSDQIYFGGLTKETTESCLRVLAALQRVPTKVRSDVFVCTYFMDAVDAVAFHDYYKRIKRPMWINKMIDKLRGGSYGSVEEVRSDMALIKANCLQYNPPTKENTDIRSLAEYLHESFERLLGEEFRGDVGAGVGGGLTDSQVYGPSSTAATADGSHKHHRHHHHDASALSHHEAGGSIAVVGSKKKDKQHSHGGAAAAVNDAGDYAAAAAPAPPAALATSKAGSKKSTSGLAAPVPKHGKKASSKDAVPPVDSAASLAASSSDFSQSALHTLSAPTNANGTAAAETAIPAAAAAAAPRLKLKFKTSSAGSALGASGLNMPETPSVPPPFAPAPAALLPLHSDDFPMASMAAEKGEGLMLEDLLEGPSTTHVAPIGLLPIDEDTLMTTGGADAHGGIDATAEAAASIRPPVLQHAGAPPPAAASTAAVVGAGHAPASAASAVGGLGSSRLKLKLGGASARTGSTPALPSASPAAGSDADIGYGGVAERAGTASTLSGGGEAGADTVDGAASTQPVLAWSAAPTRPTGSATGGAASAGAVGVSTSSAGASAADTGAAGSATVPPPRVTLRLSSQAMQAAAANQELIDETRDYTYFRTPEFQRTLRPTSLADLRLVPVGWPRQLDWLTAERHETFAVRDRRDNLMNVTHHFLLEAVKKAPGASLHLFETPFVAQNPALYGQIPLAAEGNRTLSQVYEKLRYQLPKFRTSKETAKARAERQKGPPPDKPAILRTEEDAWVTVQDMIDEIKGIFQTAIDIHTPPSTADGDAASSSAAGGVWPGPELQRRDIVSRARHALKVIDMQAVEYFADFMSAGTMRAEREATRRDLLAFVSSHSITPATHKLLRTFVKKNFLSTGSNLRSLALYFDAPVDVKWPAISADYFERIKEPMDFGSLLHNVGVDRDHCKYATHAEFHRHLMLIFENAIAYNAPKPGGAAGAATAGGASSSSLSGASAALGDGGGIDKVSRAIYDAALQLTAETEYMWPLYCFTLWDAITTEGIETAYRRERQEEDRRKKEAADRTMRDLEAAAYATKSRETARPLLETALAAALAGVPPPLETEAPDTQYLAGVLGLEAGQRLHHYTREMQRLAAAQSEVEHDAAIAGMQWRDAARAMQRSSVMQAAAAAAAAASAAPVSAVSGRSSDPVVSTVVATSSTAGRHAATSMAERAPAAVPTAGAASAAAAAGSGASVHGTNTTMNTSGMKRPLSSASVGVLFGELLDGEDDEGTPVSSGSTVSGADADEEEEEEEVAAAAGSGEAAAMPVAAPSSGSTSFSAAFVDVPSSADISTLPGRPAVRVQVAVQLRAPGPPPAKRFKA